MNAPIDTIAIQCRVCGVGLRDGAALWRENEKGQPGIWSCAKHRGRLHCIIPGCRRTYAPRPGERFDLEVSLICGRHWRMVPPLMRRIENRIRRLSRRYGWTDALIERHHRIWWRCVRAITARPIETELARLGL